MSLREKLKNIQTEVKAPKNLYNSYGNYNYRNAESICEAVKPYLSQENVSLILTDDIIAVGDRFYVKATARLLDNESDESLEVTALARESETKKGQDVSQITGTASSYARKYALNGLFLLDDTKDADTDEYQKQQAQQTQQTQQEVKKITSQQMGQLKIEMLRTGATEKYLCDFYKLDSINNMSQEQYNNAMANFKNTPDRKEK